MTLGTMIVGIMILGTARHLITRAIGVTILGTIRDIIRDLGIRVM